MTDSANHEYGSGIAATNPKPTVKRPSVRALQEMMYDGICQATDGCQVEPDGTCEHGHPSWLLELGLI